MECPPGALECLLGAMDTLLVLAYVEPEYTVRYDSKIYTCHDGKIITVRPGIQLHRGDVDPEKPEMDDEYSLSTLMPKNDDEREIIDRYNAFVTQRYQADVKESFDEYQKNTMMVACTLKCTMYAETLAKEINSQFKHRSLKLRCDVERMKIGTMYYYYVIFYP